jgi:phenylacetate-CoA ligase
MFLKSYYLATSLKNQRMNPEKLKNLQLKKLKEIINYSYAFVPYYRNHLKKSGINPNDIRNLGDIKKILHIDKKIVLKNYNDFFSDEYRKYLNVMYNMPSFLFMRSTSGTSGTAMKIFFNPDAKAFLDAIYARALLNVGYNPFKPLLYFWWQQTPQKDFYHMLNFFRKIYVLSSWDEEKQLEFMQQIKPKYIYYYPSALYFISRLILNQNLELDFKPKLIISHAELLTAQMRKNIENAFDANVYDQYGSNEFNRIAWECKERNGYHVDIDSVFLEIVDENYDEVAPGEIGKVLITGLVNKTIPLIRYEIGDFAVKSEDSQADHCCGTNLPVMVKSIEGRYEHSQRPKNKIVTQKKMLESILEKVNGVTALEKFQIFVNEKNKALTMNCIDSSEDSLKKLANRVKIKGYTTMCRNVKKINKNGLTGKTLLLEKIKS